MANDTAMLELHDRATRGESLTAADCALLEAWYSEQDGEESASLVSPLDPPSLATMRADLRQATGELAGASLRIGELASQNEAIRRENELLRSQVSQRSPIA